MTLKFSTRFIGLSTLLFLQTRSVVGQISASEIPPSETDNGIEGKYDPQNGIAQVVRGEMKGVAIIFQDDHVVVFMPQDPVLAPGQLMVAPKRVGREESAGSQA